MSPVVFRYRGLRFQFYSNEGNPREPMHVHVVSPGADAKFWLRPEVKLAYNIGFEERSLRVLVKLIENRRPELERAWSEFFGDGD